MTSFQLLSRASVAGKMSEEFKKYEDLLGREKEEFRKQLEREVSSLSFGMIKKTVKMFLILNRIRAFTANLENPNGRHL